MVSLEVSLCVWVGRADERGESRERFFSPHHSCLASAPPFGSFSSDGAGRAPRARARVLRYENEKEIVVELGFVLIDSFAGWARLREREKRNRRRPRPSDARAFYASLFRPPQNRLGRVVDCCCCGLVVVGGGRCRRPFSRRPQKTRRAQHPSVRAWRRRRRRGGEGGGDGGGGRGSPLFFSPTSSHLAKHETTTTKPQTQQQSTTTFILDPRSPSSSFARAPSL